MKIGRIDFDNYPYEAEVELGSFDENIPLRTKVTVPKELEKRSCVVAYFRENPKYYKIYISHTPFSTDLFDQLSERVKDKDGWYEDSSGQYVYIKIHTSITNLIIDTR